MAKKRTYAGFPPTPLAGPCASDLKGCGRVSGSCLAFREKVKSLLPCVVVFRNLLNDANHGFPRVITNHHQFLQQSEKEIKFMELVMVERYQVISETH